jgi:hypothetical protein
MHLRWRVPTFSRPRGQRNDRRHIDLLIPHRPSPVARAPWSGPPGRGCRSRQAGPGTSVRLSSRISRAGGRISWKSRNCVRKVSVRPFPGADLRRRTPGGFISLESAYLLGGSRPHTIRLSVGAAPIRLIGGTDSASAFRRLVILSPRCAGAGQHHVRLPRGICVPAHGTVPAHLIATAQTFRSALANRDKQFFRARFGSCRLQDPKGATRAKWVIFQQLRATFGQREWYLHPLVPSGRLLQSLTRSDPAITAVIRRCHLAHANDLVIHKCPRIY